MKRPNKSATKELIWEYVEGVEAELKAQQEGKFDPAAEKETAKKKEVAVKAEKIIARDIVNDEIKSEYACLEERITDMKSEIETLTGITVNVGTFAALIEANNLEISEVKRIKEELIAEKTAELSVLEQDIKAKKAAWSDDEKAYNAALALERKREEEDYEYLLTRKHDKEDDSWEDNKAEREKILADKESAVSLREITCKEIEVTNLTLQTKVDKIPGIIVETQNKAIKDAETKMNEKLEEKEATLRREIEFDKRMVDIENANLKAALDKSEARAEDLESKLEAAYTKMNDLATKSVQAGQTVYANKETK